MGFYRTAGRIVLSDGDDVKGGPEFLIENGSFLSNFDVVMRLGTCGKKSAASFLITVAAVSTCFPVSTIAATDPVSFNNQIQPIISEYCYHCHGPDSASRKPKKHPLRLDKEQFAFEPRDDGKPVIIKGDPKSSELVRRITAKDDDIMPPASEHKTVKAEEIVLVQRWIAEGAKYEKHWSLIPPARPALPAANGWSSQPIDLLVAQKLQQGRLKPNPPEDKARLFRRLSFDLTGLPPTPGALEKFIKDPSPKAYEHATDEMLASDASAEHFTRLWLDAVRYADTQGIHHDHSRSIWPYRDWVITAIKNNMPYDQFTIEQLAGDLLPNATMDQKIASGYNRLLPTTGEGGAIPEEYAAIYAKDRIDTTAAVWLGLTTGCADCHDHKFDALTTKEYYSMTAFFRNNTQPTLDSPTSGNVAPLLFVPAREDRPRWEALEKEITARSGEVEERKKEGRPDFEKWIAHVATASSDPEKGTPTKPVLWLPLSEAAAPWHGKFKEAEVSWAGGKESHAGPFGAAPLVAGGEIVTNAEPVIERTGQASYGAFIFTDGKPNGAVFSRMDKSANYRGWDLFFTEGRPTVHIIDKWPDQALKITARQALKPKEWHHVMAVFDGQKKGGDALALYVDGRRAEVEVNNNNLGPDLQTSVPLRLGGRSEKDGAGETLSGAKVYLQDVIFFSKALGEREVAQLAAAGLVRELVAGSNSSGEKTNALFDLYLESYDGPSHKIYGELAGLKSEEAKIKEHGATTLIYEEKKDAQPSAYVLIRGNYASKGDKVTPTVPAALPPMPADQPRNRLGLARWLVAPENPLMARVTMNRLWSHLMGIGIVETTEDLGVMGARPSNQPLLDWLAVEFRESGWNFRKMVKEMVMSATYQQSEAASKEKIEKDPQNKLFARGPHVRLDAEEIRDQALAASGLLVKKVGGPPVKPYQPEGVWESVAMKDSNTRNYVQDHGDALYRRSVYTFWKRVAPPPSMEILNAPSREVFCTRRDRTDTPLQALVTMNDPQFVEAARQLAARALRAEKTFDGRLDQITEALIGRRFGAGERKVARKLEERAVTDYQHDGDAAKQLLGVGESKTDETLAAPELAAWTLVASQVMNLDESLTK
jgi:Protein of unknown function (DUF1553)/Protein of unknown function (DUF1549)/Planctomycete cytochrome C/Concanavalin A-like lectin/glucanases superfamily